MGNMLKTTTEMAHEWGLTQAAISMITKDMMPVEYVGLSFWRRGLYNAAEVAAVLREDTEKKLRRAREAVGYYEDRLRRLAPYLDGGGETP